VQHSEAIREECLCDAITASGSIHGPHNDTGDKMLPRSRGNKVRQRSTACETSVLVWCNSRHQALDWPTSCLDHDFGLDQLISRWGGGRKQVERKRCSLDQEATQRSGSTVQRAMRDVCLFSASMWHQIRPINITMKMHGRETVESVPALIKRYY